MSNLQKQYERYLTHPDTLNDLLRELCPVVKAAVRRKLPASLQAQCDDVTQIVLCEVWTNIGRCSGQIKPWVLLMTRFRCLDYIRQQTKAKGRNQQPEDDIPERSLTLTGKPLTMPESLTQRERQIADHLSDGATVREIATDLYLTRSTVQRHICKLRRKFAA